MIAVYLIIGGAVVFLITIFVILYLRHKGLISCFESPTQRKRKLLNGLTSVPRVISEPGSGPVNPTERPPPTYFQVSAARSTDLEAGVSPAPTIQPPPSLHSYPPSTRAAAAP
ncbi:hypothetical protein HDU96_008600 [Phlyctochytrium bullatum]|nr:hypothetical protein HDU96_008600 [Phlyctochytrium bullatum]